MTWPVWLAAQVLLCLYLVRRLAPARPRSLRLGVGALLVGVFALFNVPWAVWASNDWSFWRLAREPWAVPFLAWQVLSVVYLAGVAARVIGVAALRGLRHVSRRFADSPDRAAERPQDARADAASVSRREFVQRWAWVGGYALSGAGVVGLSMRSASGDAVVRRFDLSFPDLPPAFDGYRILQVTDVHAGWNMGEDRMKELAGLVSRLEADLVAVTGDLIDWNPRDVDPYVRAFGRVRAPDGVVCVLGNHDFYTGPLEVMRGIEQAGHGLLRNAHRPIERGGARIVLAGIDDPRARGVGYTRRDPQRVEVRDALRGAPAGFRILLAHRPDAFVGAQREGVSLTLAGHTHGGQVALLGWSVALLSTPYDRGHFEEGASQLYVCPGVGVVGLPVRVGVPPEIALIRLRRSSPTSSGSNGRPSA